MIYTQYGGKIKRITRFESDTGIVRFLRGDNQLRECHIMTLKADGGMDEILQAAKLVETTSYLTPPRSMNRRDER